MLSSLSKSKLVVGVNNVEVCPVIVATVLGSVLLSLTDNDLAALI